MNASSWIGRAFGVIVIGACVWFDSLMFRHGSWLAIPFAIIATIGVLLISIAISRTRRDAELERSRRREAAFWRATFPNGVRERAGQ